MSVIQYIDRKSNEVLEEKTPGKGMLRWLYQKPFGKLMLKALVKRKFISSIAGRYMNTRVSARQVAKFVREHNIDLQKYVLSNIADYKTFNQFFYRKIKDAERPIGEHVVSPADGKVLAFQSIESVSQFFVKGTAFTIDSFLNDKQLAEKYADGAMAIIRLAPADYHRFHFPADGVISESEVIKGHYYSVSPLALNKSLEIFCQNQREYSMLKTDSYGDVLYSEVGATMVGSIIQTYQPDTEITKGAEKGYFAFGGSTIVLLFEKDKVQFDADLLANTQKGLETTICMGEQIAR